MRKRPLCLVCLLLVCWIFILDRTGRLKLPSCPEHMKQQFVQIQGQVYKQENKNQNHLLYLKNVSIISNDVSNKLYSYDFNVLVYVIKGDVSCKIGNEVTVTGICMIPEKASNPGQFDRRAYYQQQGIGFLLQKAECRRTHDKYDRYRQGLSMFRQKMKETLYSIADDADAAVLCAMLLGDNTELDSELKEIYRYAGISHILAISGLHVSLLGMFIFRSFRKVGASYAVSGIISGILMFSYGIMAGMSPSACRAILMFFVFLGAQIAGKTYDLLSGLAFAAILILLQNPAYLFHAGFLLSFLAVFGIALIYPGMKKVFLSDSKIVDSLLISISVQFMILPCMLHFYYEFSLYAVLLNLVILPGVSFVFMSGLSGAVVGTVFTKGGILAASAAHYILTGYRILGEWSIRLPEAMQLWGAPSAGRIISYYLLLGCVLLTLRFTEKRPKWIRGSQIVLAGVVLLLLMAVKPHKNLEITFLNVGQGDSIFWRTPSGTTFLCDGGSSTVSKVGTYRLEPFLKYHGIGKIDYVILSHMDADHINGIEELLQKERGGVEIACMILPDITNKDEAYQRIEAFAKEKQIKILYFHAGMIIEDGEIKIECLHPNLTYDRYDKNEGSLVFQLDYRDFSVLLTGDLEGIGEEQLLAGEKLETIEILKVAHHGSKGSTSEGFLNKTAPEIAILSYGEGNTYGHPHQELVDRLTKSGCRVISIAENGAVTLITNGSNYTLKSFGNE